MYLTIYYLDGHLQTITGVESLTDAGPQSLRVAYYAGEPQTLTGVSHLGLDADAHVPVVPPSPVATPADADEPEELCRACGERPVYAAESAMCEDCHQESMDSTRDPG